MFGPFGKKKRQRALQVKQLMGHRARVARFAQLFRSGKVEPFRIYDVKLLGNVTKAKLAASIKLWIKTCQLNPEMAIKDVDLGELLPKIAQFQEGVGGVALGINPYAIAAMDPKTEMAKMQATCVTAKMPDAHMSARVKAERERLRGEVAALTGQVVKPKKKKINFNKFFVAPSATPTTPTTFPTLPAPPPALAPSSSKTVAASSAPQASSPTIHTRSDAAKRLPLGLHKTTKRR